MTEPPTKEHTWVEPRPPHTYVVDVLGLHIGPKQLEQGLSQKLLPVHVWDVLLTGLPVWPHWERMCLALQRLDVLAREGWEEYPRGDTPAQRRREERLGEIPFVGVGD